MGFDKPGHDDFVIPVSDTQAYKQFGNSVVVPVFRSVAQLMKPHILKSVELESERFLNDENSSQLELQLVA